MLKPDLLFEVSWEVCNKVGGIHTVLTSKAPLIPKHITKNYLLIAPMIEPNSEFIQDQKLFPELCTDCKKKEIQIKCGRWLIDSSPIVIMVDFSYLLPQQNAILAELWRRYGVDSLNAKWDYIEPLLFGYAAGEIIEYYVKLYANTNDKIVAHFHEWMTGSGVLYLKSAMAHIATAFTTHATVMGRSLAGDGQNIYNNNPLLNDTSSLAAKYGVTAKHSIERATSKITDGFSAVSDITALETLRFLESQVNVITPNGYDHTTKITADRRTKARDEFIRVAQILLGKKFHRSTFIALTSGRYEYHNKGIDVILEAAKALSQQPSDHDILLFILMPAGNSGVVGQLKNGVRSGSQIANVTHYLNDYYNDSIIRNITDSPLIENRSKVQVIFVPTYIEKENAIFSMDYYGMLAGADLTLFPSYYEPWGYTPLESIAHGVATVTSSLAGFGRWVNKINVGDADSVEVINRDSVDDANVIEQIKNSFLRNSTLSDNQRTQLSRNATEFSKNFSWDKMISHYLELYNDSLSNNKGVILYEVNSREKTTDDDSPMWRRVMIEREMPTELWKLSTLINNLWITWSGDADTLFTYINPDAWRKVNHNPQSFFDEVSSSRIEQLITDSNFMTLLDDTYARFEKYMTRPTRGDTPSITYFSMEYGLTNFLQIYSGGLGILAGDYLKEASDRAVPMVAVGLLYRYGYFIQKVSSMGDQESLYEPQNFYKLPITPVRDADGVWHNITVEMGSTIVTARLWLCMVGRISLYLLDTDHELNNDTDRTITHWLYGGDHENRMRQEVLLSIGGIKALTKLGLKSDIYHCNEGHAALIGIQRLAMLTDEGVDFQVAKEIVKSSSLFTTHTPVPAGHDFFSIEMVKKYIGTYASRLKISIEELLMLGIRAQSDMTTMKEPFSMSYLAVHLSGAINGVSKIHGEVTREIFKDLWKGYFPSELPIGYVTNGIHIPTWVATPMRDIYEKTFNSKLIDKPYNKYNWSSIEDFNSAELWNARLMMKERLIKTIKRRITDPAHFRFDSPRQMLKVKESLSSDILTIGFARRYATYKRGTLLLSNLERLDAIVNNTERPVQIIFAGKAHPSDKAGADIIRKIVQVAAMPQFVGKIIFLQNYNIQLAKKLCAGVDVWLNTPMRKMEASGTSGQKCAINGVLHFSVMDGWWVEGYDKKCGWMLCSESNFEDQEHQNEFDAEIIYNTIEQEIAPLYYRRDEDNIPGEWVKWVKTSIMKIGSFFNTGRMIDDYITKFYVPLSKSYYDFLVDDMIKAKNLVHWKERVRESWSGVRVLSVKQFDMNRAEVKKGDSFLTEVSVDLGSLTNEDIGVELVVARQIKGSDMEIVNVIELDTREVKGSIALFSKRGVLENSGTYDIAVRIFAKNKDLKSRFDFPIVKWS